MADAIRASFDEPAANLHELFARISFNILCGNSDDHGRNHAAFLDSLTLTPAYDICPQARGSESRQAMAFTRSVGAGLGQRESRVNLLVDAAADYLVDRPTAVEIVNNQIATIRDNWDDVCDRAELTANQRAAFMGTQFLSQYALS